MDQPIQSQPSSVTLPLIPGNGPLQQQNYELTELLPENQCIAASATLQIAEPVCPPGLEYLTYVDQLLVHQEVQMSNEFPGYEYSSYNKYTVKNNTGEKVGYAVEESHICTRTLCGPFRPFVMKIFDSSRREVIQLHRQLTCLSCCFPNCLQRFEVTAPAGNTIGYVIQEWGLCPKYRIEDVSGDCVLRIKSHQCMISCCSDIEFEVLSADGQTNVGKITKQWRGLSKEMFSITPFSVDNIYITFPMDLDVNKKALLLGACFLTDFGAYSHKRIMLYCVCTFIIFSILRFLILL